MNLTTVWEKAQNEIKEKIGETSYGTWFTAIHVKEKDNDTLIIETPDDFFKGWIIEHYEKFIQDTLTNLASRAVQLEFSVNNNHVRDDTQSKILKFEPEIQRNDPNLIHLNNRFTFENFVIGPSNRFACAACLAVAESPARAYNPLLIYGPVGLGKTHLVQSITHKIKTLHPNAKACYMTSERFTNELIDAIRHRSTTEFRKKYRDIDVLLIDDIQFIAGKESTQEEFFHTFNYLHDNRKQIIITSDRPPKDIANLEERLRSRFAWGLITDIQPPDYETRMAILKKKIENEPVKVPQEVISFIAEQVTSNIRELEGALIRVAAYALMEEKTITLEMTKFILKDVVKESVKTMDANLIQKTVADYFKLSLADLRSKHRNKNIVLARQIAMYLTRTMTNLSLPEIGNIFGGKDHTTVMHSLKKIEVEIVTDKELDKLIHELAGKLKH